MKYDFTTLLDRRGKDSIAADLIPWERKPDPGVSVIPMWVADMSFPTAPPILEAIRARLEMPNFGYFRLPDSYFDAIVRWQRRRNGVQSLTPADIGYENGVLGGVASAVCALSAPGDPILVHSPTYIGFTHTLNDLGRKIVHSPLRRDEAGVWRMDYEDMDAQLKAHHIHLAILCSPHNPCGRVWERRELEKAMEVYAANDCYVISDEIWSDIILPGHRHIPTQSVSDDARQRTIAFYAPSKTFSLAGLIGSYHIIYNSCLRDRVRRVSGSTHYNDCNVLSLHALLGAYSEAGEEWVDEMRQVIDENCRYACEFIAAHFPGVRVMRPQGTYMLFLDCGDYLRARGEPLRELEYRGVRAGVIWQDGEAFEFPDSIRMNLALPKALLVEAMERLRKYAFQESPKGLS